MSHSNISIFVPHVGCPHMCAFCNQRAITGSADIPHGNDVERICSEQLAIIKDCENTEIAFFGGSFTAIDKDYMVELLSAANKFVGEGKFKGIRISTRPDYIDANVLMLLKMYGVTAIELGAQSMCDDVLLANERGHTSADVEEAASLIKKFGFELGLQMMVGLYKSTKEKENETFEKIEAMYPDTVRIYPVVILEGTKLGELYKSGEYVPFDFDEVVSMCSMFMHLFQLAGIRVIKVGLHASEIVEEQMLGGFYHPAFRELCEGRLYLNQLKSQMNFHAHLSGQRKISMAEFTVPPKNISKALGQKKCNIKFFEEYGIKLIIKANENQTADLKIVKTE